MNERPELRSEGAEVDSFLEELQYGHQVKEISGWSTGFENLDRALDGLRPGLYLLAGPPGCGKTSLARQLLDQIVLRNSISGIYFSFTESRKVLRIRTLARLSGMEMRDVRRGSAYLLHRYGVPRLTGDDTSQLVPSWEKVKRITQEAKSWLDRIYLMECDRAIDLHAIEEQIATIKDKQQTESFFIVVDDCQRLSRVGQAAEERLAGVAERLQALAQKFAAVILAICPIFTTPDETIAQRWAERITGAEVIMVMQTDGAAREKTQTHQASTLHIIRNRGGERGRLAFEFTPATALFVEAAGKEITA